MSIRTRTKVIRRKHIIQPTGFGAYSSTCCLWEGEDVPAPWEWLNSHPPVPVQMMLPGRCYGDWSVLSWEWNYYAPCQMFIRADKKVRAPEDKKAIPGWGWIDYCAITTCYFNTHCDGRDILSWKRKANFPLVNKVAINAELWGRIHSHIWIDIGPLILYDKYFFVNRFHVSESYQCKYMMGYADNFEYFPKFKAS